MIKRIKLLISLFISLISLNINNIDNESITIESNNVALSTATSFDYASSYADVIKGVVRITNYSATTYRNSTTYEKESFGSGFFYDSDSTYYYLLTNQHVVDEADMLSITTYINEEIQNVKVVGYDKEQDVAVVKVDKSKINSDIKLLELNKNSDNSFDDPIVGEEVYAIGSPGSQGFQGTLTKGIVSGIKRIVTESSNNIYTQSHAIQTDCAINPGNSGGPLFNTNNKVIGINSLKLGGEDNLEEEALNFSLPIGDMYKFATLIRNNASSSKTFKNTTRYTITSTNKFISVKDMSLRQRSNYGLDFKYEGVVILENDTKNSLPKGSLIISLDGKETKDVVDYRRILLDRLVNSNTTKIEVKYYKCNDSTIEDSLTTINASIYTLSV